MPELHILVNIEESGGFDALNGVDPDDIVHLANDAKIEIGALTGGMASGEPSIAICTSLPGGKALVMETSLRLLLAATDAFKARHGDPRMADLSMPEITLPPDFPPLALVRGTRAMAEKARDSLSSDAFDKLQQVIRLLVEAETAEGMPSGPDE